MAWAPMTDAWCCDAEAQRTQVTLPEIELTAEIGRYNEVDCCSMAEALGWLREPIKAPTNSARATSRPT